MRTRLLLVSHGFFAREILNVSRMLMGESEDVTVFGLEEGESVEEFMNGIRDAVADADQENPVLCLCDIRGGTPFNVCNALSMGNPYLRVLYGTNVPIFIESLTQRDEMSFDELIRYLGEEGSGTVGIIPVGGKQA